MYDERPLQYFAILQKLVRGVLRMCRSSRREPRQDEGQDRYSLGVYYSRLCDRCWKNCGVRKEGPEGFDPLDAGESLEPDDGEAW